MKCCAIATENHVNISWGVDSPPETFLEEMRKWPVMPKGEVTKDGKGVELSIFCEEEHTMCLTHRSVYDRVIRPGDELERVVGLDERGEIPSKSPKARFSFARGSANFTESAEWLSGWEPNGIIYNLYELRELSSRFWTSLVRVDCEKGTVSIWGGEHDDVIVKDLEVTPDSGLYRSVSGEIEIGSYRGLWEKHNTDGTEVEEDTERGRIKKVLNSVYGVSAADVIQKNPTKTLSLRRGSKERPSEFARDLFELPEVPFTVGRDPEDDDVVVVLIGGEMRYIRRGFGVDVVCKNGEHWSFKSEQAYVHGFDGYSCRVVTVPGRTLGRYYAPQTVGDLREMARDPRVSSITHEDGLTTVSASGLGEDVSLHVKDRGGIVLWNGWKSPSFVKNGETIEEGLAFAPVKDLA
jgi:hypothetical protein